MNVTFSQNILLSQCSKCFFNIIGIWNTALFLDWFKHIHISLSAMSDKCYTSHKPSPSKYAWCNMMKIYVLFDLWVQNGNRVSSVSAGTKVWTAKVQHFKLGSIWTISVGFFYNKLCICFLIFIFFKCPLETFEMFPRMLPCFLFFKQMWGLHYVTRFLFSWVLI